jgi:alpha-tubulin suppressor-like RCC1 family protein
VFNLFLTETGMRSRRVAMAFTLLVGGLGMGCGGRSHGLLPKDGGADGAGSAGMAGAAPDGAGGADIDVAPDSAPSEDGPGDSFADMAMEGAADDLMGAPHDMVVEGAADGPVDMPVDAPTQADAKPGADGPSDTSAGGCTPANTPTSCGVSCEACTAPSGGTPACVVGVCDFSCGTTKKCATAKLCVAAAGCCESADCPPQGGKVGSCDTSTHACSYACAANMVACGGTCIPAGGCCTDKDCPGACQKCGTNHACAAAVSEDDPTGRCSGTCDDAGRCKSKQGQRCTSATADGCVASAQCVDAFCCDTACTSSCLACDVTGKEGTCSAVPSGAPHGGRAACVGAGTACGGACGGRGDGACAYPTSACGAATCSGTDKVVPQGTCGGGACVAPAALACSTGYACFAGACKSSCASAGDCQTGFTCASNACRPHFPIAIAAGGRHACVILTDGTVRCWGDNSQQQLGNPTAGGVSFKPVVVNGITKAVAIGAGFTHTCVVVSDGTVRCWGGNDQGQLGIGNAIGSSASPVTVAGVTTAKTVDGGVVHSCALLLDGSVSCWGAGDVVGRPGLPPRPVAAGLVANLSGVTSLDAGPWHTCALKASDIWCWGNNSYGELGVDPGLQARADVPIRAPGTGFALVAAGGSFTCADQPAAATLCWGAINTDGPMTWIGRPISGFSVSIRQIAAGSSPLLPHACAVLAQGSVACWGSNDLGSLGANPSITQTSATAIVDGAGVQNPVALAAGDAFTCALDALGGVRCWGRNGAGEVGADPNLSGGADGLPQYSYKAVPVTGW